MTYKEGTLDVKPHRKKMTGRSRTTFLSYLGTIFLRFHSTGHKTFVNEKVTELECCDVTPHYHHYYHFDLIIISVLFKSCFHGQDRSRTSRTFPFPNGLARSFV